MRICPTHHEPADRHGRCTECLWRTADIAEHERDTRQQWAQR